MTIIDIPRGQHVKIPAVQLTSGREFTGMLKASDGETLVLELDEQFDGRLPEHVDDLCVVTWIKDGLQRACPIIVRSHSARAIVAQVVIQERREAPRLRVDVQVQYEVVAPTRVKETSEEVLSRVNTTEDPASEALNLLNNGSTDPLLQLKGEVAQLREIIQELVVNIADLTALVVGGTPPQAPANQPRTPLAIMNCSSTGLGIIVTESLQEGDYLRLQLVLRTVPKTMIECMGVVVRCIALERREGEAAGRRYDVGVRYTHIHESDRERLIHYLFKVQRKLLRDLKEARDVTGEQQKKVNSPVHA